MKRTTLSAVVAGLLFATVATASPLFASGFERAPCPLRPQAQFVMEQNLTVETVTCASWFSHTDFQGYGELTATGCTTTGPLLNDGGGAAGHVTVSFTFTDGSAITLGSCRIDSTVLQPGWDSQAVNCTHP